MSSSLKVTGRELSWYLGNRDTSRLIRYGAAFVAGLSLVSMVGLATRMGFLAERGVEYGKIVRGPHFITFMVLLALHIASVAAVMYFSSARKEELSKRSGLYDDGVTCHVAPDPGRGGAQADDPCDLEKESVVLPVSFAAGGRVNPLSNPVAVVGIVLLAILSGIGGAMGPGAVPLMIGRGFAGATPLQKAWAVFFVVTVAFLFAASIGLFQSGGNRLMTVSSGDVENVGIVSTILAATTPVTAFDDVVSVHVHDPEYTGPGISPLGLA
ncbi:MAG: hypothetical protein ACTJLK_02645, partial [Anaplasma sp.]